MIRATIAELYVSPQRHRAAEVVQEVRRRCHRAGLQSPSEKAIRARIQAIRPEESVRRRHRRQAARRLTPVQGAFPPVTTPLEVVQMDHTVVDCIIVDEHTRQPIGRPYITVGIDMYSRCITGFCLTLEAPSSVSVGLCLAHLVLDKETELRRLGLEGEWPIWILRPTSSENIVDNPIEAIKRTMGSVSGGHDPAVGFDSVMNATAPQDAEEDKRNVPRYRQYSTNEIYAHANETNPSPEAMQQRG